MKKLLMIVAAGLLFSSAAMGECELMDFIGGESKETSGAGNALLEISSAWSSSSSTYASAQTSGTSGCGETALFRVRQRQFVHVMIDNLSQEIAAGGGEHLQSLSALLGCPKSKYSDLALMARQNYEQLFPAVETEPEIFLTRLKEEMGDSPELSENCVYI
jgi:hypothetical protein